MTVSLQRHIEFFFRRSCNEIVRCDILHVIVGHILLGWPWLFNHQIIYDGYASIYEFWKDGRKIMLLPIRRTMFTPTVHQISTRVMCKGQQRDRQSINSTGSSSVKPRGMMQPTDQLTQPHIPGSNQVNRSPFSGQKEGQVDLRNWPNPGSKQS